MDAALARAARRGTRVSTIVDVGASDGRWFRVAAPFFPAARALLVEARREHEAGLRALVAESPGVEYVISAAGDAVGEIYFDAADLFGGMASYEPVPEHCIRVPMTTVDVEVKARGLRGPFLLKLDTHGFELPILEGAKEALRETSLLVIEAYNFRIGEGVLRFHEMCGHLEGRGFRCVDLCDPLHRPRDGALWQLDLFFSPAGAEAFRSEAYE